MALQGTLETFSVPEVLRLLAGTRKTGRLALEGDRGVGNVWLTEGRISTARSEHEQGDRIEAVLFDLLRFANGSFVFEPDVRPDDDAVHDADVEEVLTEAERLLEEWREIEAVVPSLDVRVHLVDELTGESVTVTADQWRSLALIGSGITARRIGANLDLGEFDACSLVRDLVEAGLVHVTEDVDENIAAEEPAAAPVTARADDDRLVDHDLSHDEVASLGQNLAGFVAGTSEEPPVDRAEPDTEFTAELDNEFTAELDTEFAAEPDAEFAADEAPGAHELTDAAAVPADEVVDVSAERDAEDDIEPEDFLSQLSNLSPKAAAAIEATAEPTAETTDAGSDEADAHTVPSDSDAPLAPVADVDGDEEINRNLLLKFLSSAKN